MWKAKIASLTENSVPNDTVEINITFSNDIGKEFTKSYSFHAGGLQDIQALKDFAQGEIDKLSKFDDVKITLEQYIDQDIATIEIPIDEVLEVTTVLTPL